MNVLKQLATAAIVSTAVSAGTILVMYGVGKMLGSIDPKKVKVEDEV